MITKKKMDNIEFTKAILAMLFKAIKNASFTDVEKECYIGEMIRWLCIPKAEWTKEGVISIESIKSINPWNEQLSLEEKQSYLNKMRSTMMYLAETLDEKNKTTKYMDETKKRLESERVDYEKLLNYLNKTPMGYKEKGYEYSWGEIIVALKNSKIFKIKEGIEILFKEVDEFKSRGLNG